jgi:rhodanese-related sulfurtransferase
MIKRAVISILTAILLVGGIVMSAGTVQGLIKKVPGVETNELKTWLSSPGDQVIVDVRTDSEREIDKLDFDGVVHIPLQELPDRIEELAGYRYQTIVVVCPEGSRSRQAVRWLRKAGYDAVFLRGGLNGFNEEQAL